MPKSRRVNAARSARKVALVALRQWRQEQTVADALAGELLNQADLETRDRAFALELFYGVLRNRSLLDYWNDRLRHGKVDVDLRDVLRLGLYQLLLLKTAEHAAVYETVDLARPRSRTLVNAVLRNAVRQRDDLVTSAAAQPLSIRTSHPEFLIDRWTQQFGQDATEQLCQWNNEPPPLYGRVNELRLSRDEFLQRYPSAQPLPEHPRFVRFDSVPAEALARGDCYIQDPSTATACELLAPLPGEKVLDACAAPGGKTSYLGELMQNQGMLLACDRDQERLNVLRDNVARLGIRIADIVRADWTRSQLPKEVISQAPFDRILLDVPCSNTGVMRRRPDVRWRLRRDAFGHMQDRQLAIARVLLPLLKVGGVFVYSTCSIEPEENEALVDRLTRDLRGWRCVEQQSTLPFRDNVDGAFAAKLIREA